jgi:hypothetical protein
MAGPAPDGAPVWYQKQMAHHMLPGFGLDWIDACTNVFLIRRPELVLASYTQKRGEVTLDDIGIVRQCAIFEHVIARTGKTPLVIEGAQVLADPRTTLAALCEAVGIPFSDRMLSWPAGRRDSDGIWAPAWYDAVERSTGFSPPPPEREPDLSPELRAIADAARPYYDRLARHRLVL